MEGAKQYITEAYNELMYKVTWPTAKELQSTSTVVIIASIIFALIVFVMDFIFGANPENSIFNGILYWVYQIFA